MKEKEVTKGFMKTIHIHYHNPDGWLMKKLYKDFLKNDNLWHFVYWRNGWTHKAFLEGRNLIIRVEDPEVMNKITGFLKNTPEVDFEVYDFPFCRGKYELGIKRLSWEARHLDLAKLMLHVISEARMQLGNGRNYKEFIDRYFHILFNIGGFSHIEELRFLIGAGYDRIGLIENWYGKIFNSLKKQSSGK